MIKSCVSLFIVFLVIPKIKSVSDEMKELAAMLHKTCQEKSGVADDILDAAVNKKEVPEDKNLKCYMKCLLAEMAIMEEDGSIDVEAAINVMPEEIKDVMEPTVRACASEMPKLDDHCEIAYWSYKCMHDKDLEHYMLV